MRDWNTIPERERQRIDQVAGAILRSEFDGNVTYEVIERKYGADEAMTMRWRYRGKAADFLAAYDAAQKFPINRSET